MFRRLFVSLIVSAAASSVLLKGQVGPAPPRPTLVTLDKAEAARLAAAGRTAAAVEMPEGVELKLWAPDGLIANPVAVEVDAQGTVYVAGTQRNNLPLDIRGHQDWMTTAHTLKTSADLLRFYQGVMSPANSARNAGSPTPTATASATSRTSPSSRSGSTASATPTATASPINRRSFSRASTPIRCGTPSAASSSTRTT